MNAIATISTKFETNYYQKQTRSGMLSDEEVILKYKATGTKRLLAPLFKKYNEKLFGLAFYYLHERESAMDTVMESFEVVLKSIDNKDITYFKGWVMSICKNICLKKIRDVKKFDELKEISDTSVEYDQDSVYKDETIEKLLEFIPQLKEKQRICIHEFYLLGKSYDDISAMHSMSFKEVKSYIQNGKRNLKVMFEKNAKSIE